MSKRIPGRVPNTTAHTGTLQIDRKQATSSNFPYLLENNFPSRLSILGSLVESATVGTLAGTPRDATMVSLFIACAVAGGGDLAPWGKGSGVAVDYLDGTRRPDVLQEHVRRIFQPNADVKVGMDNLRIGTRASSQELEKACLDEEFGQQAIEGWLRPGCQLLIINNLSGWIHSGRLEMKSLLRVMNWITGMRSKGTAVIIAYQPDASPSMARNISSAVGNDADYSIKLLVDHLGADDIESGMSMILEYEKAHVVSAEKRYLRGTIFHDLEKDALHWKCEAANLTPLLNPKDQEIAKLLTRPNLLQKDIARLADVSESKVTRVKKHVAQISKTAGSRRPGGSRAIQTRDSGAGMSSASRANKKIDPPAPRDKKNRPPLNWPVATEPSIFSLPRFRNASAGPIAEWPFWYPCSPDF